MELAEEVVQIERVVVVVIIEFAKVTAFVCIITDGKFDVMK